MDRIDRLKLSIYESSFDYDDKEELLDIVESCDCDEEVLESVEDLVYSEATRLTKELEKNRQAVINHGKKYDKKISDLEAKINNLQGVREKLLAQKENPSIIEKNSQMIQNARNELLRYRQIRGKFHQEFNADDYKTGRSYGKEIGKKIYDRNEAIKRDESRPKGIFDKIRAKKEPKSDYGQTMIDERIRTARDKKAALNKAYGVSEPLEERKPGTYLRAKA